MAEKRDYKAERKKDAESEYGHIYELKKGGYIVNPEEEGYENQEYVFISYSSKNWDKVLYEIVYETCKKFGMRVYFDTCFDDESDSWITQFYNNMKHQNCKAVLAFFTPEYYTSYATLMELMASQSNKVKKLVLPISIGEAGIGTTNNSGLGTYRFANGSKNDLWGPELKRFNEDFINVFASKEYDSLKDRYYTHSKDTIDYKATSDAYWERLDRDKLFENKQYWTDLKLHFDNSNEKNAYWNKLNPGDKRQKNDSFLTEEGNLNLVTTLKQLIKNNNIDGVNKDIPQAIYDKLNKTYYSGVFDEKLIDWDFRKEKETKKTKINHDTNYHNEEKTNLRKHDFSQIFPEPLVPSKGTTYHITGKKYDAYFTHNEDDTFTVLKGSRIAYDWNAYVSNDIKQRASNIFDDNFVLREDITIEAQSTTAKFIKGTSTNGSDILSEKNLVKDDETVKVNLSEVHDNLQGIETVAPAKTSSDNDGITGPTRLPGEGIIDGPIPVSGGGYAGGKATKKKTMKLPEMIERGIVSVGDVVYVKNRLGNEGVLQGGDQIAYQGVPYSLNQYVSAILGPGSRNAYDFVLHKETGKKLTDLRDEYFANAEQ